MSIKIYVLYKISKLTYKISNMLFKISDMLYKISYIGYILFTKEDISFIQSNKISHLVHQKSYLVY